MRPVNDERGAVAILVAFLIVPLIGFGALAIDVSSLYQEKRELQNGADAGALAVAKDCATDDLCIPEVAQPYADDNADDGTSLAEEVCGTGPNLAACADPPAVPAGTEYVRVTTRTIEAGGADPDQMNFKLAPVLELIAGNSYDGQAVRASAVAAWGTPAGATTLPLTFSVCEYNKAIAANPLQPGPTYSGSPSIVYFHGTDHAEIGCGATNPGGDFPGGFGWLQDDDTKNDCQVTLSDESWAGDKTGVAVPNGCDPTDWRNKTVLLPIFDAVNGMTGTNGEYHIVSFAAFHITGYVFSGEKWNMTKCPPPPPETKEDGNDRCLQGHFTTLVTSGTEFGDGPDMGVTIVKLVG